MSRPLSLWAAILLGVGGVGFLQLLPRSAPPLPLPPSEGPVTAAEALSVTAVPRALNVHLVSATRMGSLGSCSLESFGHCLLLYPALCSLQGTKQE